MAQFKANYNYKDKELKRVVEKDEELEMTVKRADEVNDTLREKHGEALTRIDK